MGRHGTGLPRRELEFTGWSKGVTHLFSLTVSCIQSFRADPPPAHPVGPRQKQRGRGSGVLPPPPPRPQLLLQQAPVGAAQCLDLVVPSLMRVQSAPQGRLYPGITARANIC